MKPLAVIDAGVRPTRVFFPAARTPNTAVCALVGAFPAAIERLADRGHDPDRFHNAQKESGILPCIPSRK